MREKTPEEIKLERDALLDSCRRIQEGATRNEMILALFVSAGLITQDQIESAKSFLNDVKPVSPL